MRLAQRIMDSEAGAATPASGPAAPPAPATPEIPSAAGPTPGQAYALQQQQQQAAQAAAGQLPEGIMTQAEMEAHERRPTPKSWDEQKAQMAEGERYLESFKFHQGIR